MTPTEEAVAFFKATVSLAHFEATLFDRVVYHADSVETAVASLQKVSAFRLFWALEGDAALEAWIAHVLRRIALWRETEEQRRQAAEALRLSLAEQLGKVDWRQLPWSVLNDTLLAVQKCTAKLAKDAVKESS